MASRMVTKTKWIKATKIARKMNNGHILDIKDGMIEVEYEASEEYYPNPNVGIGYQALASYITGSDNVFIGTQKNGIKNGK